jgi:hypothetical protein
LRNIQYVFNSFNYYIHTENVRDQFQALVLAAGAAVAAVVAAVAGAGVFDFLVGPINWALSAGVWNLPWPNLDDVSMNFSSIFSKATRLALVTNA